METARRVRSKRLADMHEQILAQGPPSLQTRIAWALLGIASWNSKGRACRLMEAWYTFAQRSVPLQGSPRYGALSREGGGTTSNVPLSALTDR